MKAHAGIRETSRWFTALAIAAAAACASAAHSVNGLPVAEPAYDEARLAALDDAIAAGTYRDIEAIVVLQDGELLVERYYGDANRDTTHNPRSVGKTFAATILGIAVADGHVSGVDATLGDFYDLDARANPSPAKAGVTLRQLMTMTSGFEGFDFDADSIGNEENMYPQDDWVAWTLDLPMATDRAPGEAWRYFTAGIVVLGDIIHRAVPGGLEAYAHDRLFAPLGIENYRWQHTPQGVANTAGGIQLTAVDFAKYGELHRRRGEWNGRQIVPAAWVDAMFDPVVETTVAGNRYGWLWWHQTYDVDGRQLQTSYCSGNGGNKIFVFDDEGLVVVVTASAYGRPYMHRQVDEMMVEYILPAVTADRAAGVPST